MQRNYIGVTAAYYESSSRQQGKTEKKENAIALHVSMIVLVQSPAYITGKDERRTLMLACNEETNSAHTNGQLLPNLPASNTVPPNTRRGRKDVTIPSPTP